jgi:hypothetical protein
MKLLLALLATVPLSVGAAACGGTTQSGGSETTQTRSATTASTQAATTSGTASTGYYVKADQDKDNDVGAPYDDTNNNSVLDYGHAASPSDDKAVTALVKRYYTAAAAGDGASACSMIIPSLAKAVPEDYGRAPGPTYLRGGKSCPAVMSLLFKHSHQQLATYLATLKVVRVRLNGKNGLVVLSFGTLPERQISVDQHGSAWKIEALLDSELP